VYFGISVIRTHSGSGWGSLCFVEELHGYSPHVPLYVAAFRCSIVNRPPQLELGEIGSITCGAEFVRVIHIKGVVGDDSMIWNAKRINCK
jgi:hypothetical protein